jgi:single-strand DNA-binding protein
MSSFNKVILMGNLTRDPELRVTSGGLSICKISVATTRTFKGQDGSQREETTFVDIDAFSRQAEVISKYFSKGKPILVEGRLKLDSWESSTGEKRNKLKVILENFSFVGVRNESESRDSEEESTNQSNYEQNSPPPRQTPVSKPKTPPVSTETETLDEKLEDIPF